MMEGASPGERVGIFGGSFNPPHVGHLIIAELVREQFGLDRILWIPNRRSPFKDAVDLAPTDDRMEMTRRAVAGHDAFSVSDVEVRRNGISYTVDTIHLLQQKNPQIDYRLIIGGDSLASFDAWHRPEEILRCVRIIVFRRPGHPDARAPEELAERVDFADAPLLEISSTFIRQRMRRGRTIRYMVPERVYGYIMERGLYRE